MRAVHEDPGVGVRELGRWAGTDAMNAKRLVDHLERAGLVESTVDPRHRQRRAVRPTARGNASATEIARRAAPWQHQMARGVGRTELAELCRPLGRLEEAVAGDRKGPSAQDVTRVAWHRRDRPVDGPVDGPDGG